MRLRNDLKADDWERILETFDYKCPLTGSENITMDHFIPLNTGHGGTFVGNIYPLNPFLNNSKSARNPYVWIEYAVRELGASYEGFRKVERILAIQQGITVDELRKRVKDAFEGSE